MIQFFLTICLSTISPGEDARKPTEAELRRAYDQLSGTWKFISITDKGEKIGPRSIETRFARDVTLTVDERTMAIVNPETGEQRTASYRIDPTTNPHRIDLITRDARIFHGVYRFEDDDLVLCLKPGESKSLPELFASPQDSDLILIRLKSSLRRSSAGVDLFGPSVSRTERKIVEPGPSEGALRRAHELLSGSWDILSFIDDGATLAPDLIRAKFAENGRVQIGTRTVALVYPKTGERRISALRIDPSKTPSEIDLTTQFDEVLKGIYRINGDELSICLAKRDGDERPTEFHAPLGSNDALLRLKMARTDLASPATRSVPRPVDPRQQEVERIKRRIAGAWSYKDSRGILSLVFREDGTFTATRSWQSGIKRIFEGDTTTSNGRWSYSGGFLDTLVTSTMDPKLLSRNFRFSLQSIGDNTLVVKNLFGELVTAQRLR